MTALRIVFAGTPAFGLPCLDAIHASSHELVAIYTQPDRKAGRGRKLQASEVKMWGIAHNVPVYQPVNFKDDVTKENLKALNADVLVVIAYGLILPVSVLNIPRLGCVNVHASLLPAWRGASPITQSILHGDTTSGVTIMQMNAGMDTGDMLVQVSCPISSQDTGGSLHDKLSQLSVSPLLDTLEALSLGTCTPQKQNDTLATYASKLTKEQALIQWHLTAIELDRQIRAFNPWPVAYTQIGEEVIRIHQARVVTEAHQKIPGTVLTVDKLGIKVATGLDALLIEKLQFSGGKVLTVADCLNAKRALLQPGIQFR